jgi:hypothetical protein
MEKRTIVAAVVALFLAGAAFMLMRQPEKGQRRGPAPRPVDVVKAADVTALEVWNDKQEHTVLEKDKTGQWQVTQPSQWKADQNAVKTLLDGLEKLTFGDVVTENKSKHEEMGVADGKAPRVMAKAGGKTVADLLVGKMVGGYTMARTPGKDDVWQSSGLFPYAVSKDPKGFRDHTIFDFAAQDVDKLTIESGGNKLVLEKQAADKDAKPGDVAKWKIAESTGNGPKTSDALDDTQVNGAIQSLATLHASDFADDKKRDDVKATVIVTASIKGAAHTLTIGEPKGEDSLAVSGESPQVYSVKKFAVDRVAKKPIDYRDKTLVKAPEADIASLTITNGADSTTLTNASGKWTAQKGTADDAKVKPVVASFANLQADSFADEKDFAKTGLAKPTGDVVVHMKDKRTVALKIGAATKDGEYFVQKTGSPDIYMVKKFAVDRFLKKPTELTKK